MSADFTGRLTSGQPVIGYWCVLDSPAAAERVAAVGYDYVCFDGQHGLLGYDRLMTSIMAVDAAATTTEAAGRRSASLVRVGANDPYLIGRALDAGATGVIVPLVDDAAQAAAAVAACRYPPHGIRSYGPMRSGLRIGPTPADSNATTVVLAMIETPQGLENLEAICATPGLTGVYVGPSDLTLAVGGSSPTDASVREAFDVALERVLAACRAAGIVAGIHTPDGATARRRLEQGFTLVSIASDVVHLQTIAREHLGTARTAADAAQAPAPAAPASPGGSGTGY